MHGLMQDVPLTLPHLFERAERLFADKEVVTVTGAGRDRLTYGEWAERARRLGGVLDALGVSPDGRVATFAWNTARHLELYFAAPCTGRVLHTLNIRLSAEQLVYVANHAEDEVIFVDRSLARLLFPLVGQLTTVKHVVVMDDGTGDVPPIDGGRRGARLRDPARRRPPADFRVDDEWRAASMCYTSGTTGNPKGVVYTHRSSFLHTLGVMAGRHTWRSTSPTGCCRSSRCSTPTPGAGPRRGGRGRLAGHARARPLPRRGGRPHRVGAGDGGRRGAHDLDGGAPRAGRPRHRSLRASSAAAPAVPTALSEAYRASTGLPILQAWGMTETSPVGAVCHIKSTLDGVLDEDGRADLRTSVGQPAVGVEARITRPDSTDRRRRCRGTAPPPASCRCGARGSPPATTTTPGRPTRSPPTGGSGPATSPPSTATGTSAWSTGPRT